MHLSRPRWLRWRSWTPSSFRGIRGVEMPVLACLLQMILVYPQLIRVYMVDLRLRTRQWDDVQWRSAQLPPNSVLCFAST